METVEIVEVQEVDLQTITLPSGADEMANAQSRSTLIAMRDHRLYVRQENRLNLFIVDLAENKFDLRGPVDDNCAADLLAFGEYLYWRDNDKSLRRGTLYDNRLKVLTEVTDNFTAHDLGATKDRMYWNDKGEKTLRMGVDDFSNPDGGRLNVKVCYPEAWDYEYVAADEDYVFGANPNDNKIARFRASEDHLTLERVYHLGGLKIQYLTASDGFLVFRLSGTEFISYFRY